ncbi:MAG: NMCC_0638 family (lipo)protein [Saezia sp.]
MTTISMKTRLLALLLPMLMAFVSLTAHAQWREPQSIQDAIFNASPALKKHYANVFMNAFKNLCIANMGRADQLSMQLKDMPNLSPELTKTILNGAPGKAWALEGSKENGVHILATMNDHYYCAVHTMIADPAEMERLFDEIAAIAPEKSEFSLLKEEQIEQDNGNIMRRKTYTLTNKENPIIIQFTLKTNSIAQKNATQGTVFILIDKI